MSVAQKVKNVMFNMSGYFYYLKISSLFLYFSVSFSLVSEVCSVSAHIYNLKNIYLINFFDLIHVYFGLMSNIRISI